MKNDFLERLGKTQEQLGLEDLANKIMTHTHASSMFMQLKSVTYHGVEADSWFAAMILNGISGFLRDRPITPKIREDVAVLADLGIALAEETQKQSKSPLREPLPST